MWVCKNDETENRDDILICPVCGRPRVETENVSSETKPSASGGPRTVCRSYNPKEGSSSVPESGWHCTACRSYNSADASFCGGCGRRRGELSAKPSGGWTCNACGATNIASAVFCKSCGAARNRKPAPPELPKPSTPPNESVDRVRMELCKLERRVKWMRSLAICCIVALLIMFAAPYAMPNGTWQEAGYTIYRNMLGEHGEIEQICTLALLFFAILPLPFLLVQPDVHRRNLPVPLTLLSAGCITLYCAVIGYGSYDPTEWPFVMSCCAAAEVLFAWGYVAAVKKKENMLISRPGDL